MRSVHLGRDLRSAAPPFSCRDPFFPSIVEAGFVCLTRPQPDYITKRSQKWTAADMRTQSSCDQAISSSPSSFSFPFLGTYVGMSYTDGQAASSVTPFRGTLF